MVKHVQGRKIGRRVGHEVVVKAFPAAKTADMKYHLKPPLSKQVETNSKVGKWRIFYPLHGFILDFGGKGVCCSNLFCPRLSKTETGVTQSIMYGNHDLKVVVARFWSLTLWTQTWLHQALGFHGNNHFHYRDLTLIEPKNSFPVTCPDIFRLTDENTQIKYFSTQILNQYSNSLWLSFCTNEILKRTLPFFYSTVLTHSENALHVTDDSRVKDMLQLTAAIVMASSTKKKMYDSKSLKTIRM